MRYTEDKFYDVYASTIGAELALDGGISPTSIRTHQSVYIWDTAGREKEKDTVRRYLVGAHGFLVVFDITDRASLDHARAWIDELRAFHVPMVLVGTKADLAEQRQVTSEMARDCGLPYFEVSAKQKKNVRAPFFLLSDLAEAARPHESTQRCSIL
jgi:small GTP-binding protein